LAQQALDNDQFTVRDMADSVRMFHTALPKNFFGHEV